MTAEDSVSPRQFFHGTREDLDDQDYVLPATQTGHSPTRGSFAPTRAALKHVYFTKSVEDAQFWGETRRTQENERKPVRVYQVDPEGVQENGYSAERAKIINRVK